MGLSVGIDFGTSNSGVSIFRDGKVIILPVDEKNITPEVVKTILYITRDNKSYIGQEAVELYYRHNVNRLRRFFKKRVGEIEYRGADMFYVRDVYAMVDELMPGRLLQYLKTALRTEGFEGTWIFEKYYTVAELITVYLQQLKMRAETLLGDKIDSVTLGRPVRFSTKSELDQKAEATLHAAAAEAGFRKVKFELEPVAAALSFERSLDKPQTTLIFDFGGGTLDITIMRLGDPYTRTVYANGGVDIAGSDFDRIIIQKRMLRHFGKGLIEHRRDIAELVEAVADWMTLPELSVPKARIQIGQAIAAGEAVVPMKRLESLIFNDLAFSFYNAVETAKINLSSQGAAVISLMDADIDLWELYTRLQFENDIAHEREQIEKVLMDTINSSGLRIDQIDAVVTTGGSSNIPAFTAMLRSIFGYERVKAANAFSSVTAGLGIKAAGMNKS